MRKQHCLRGACLAAVLLLSFTGIPSELAAVEPVVSFSGPAVGPVQAIDGAGEIDDSYGLREERLRLRGTLAGKLLALAVDEAVAVTDWPLSPGRRAAVELVRQEPYSAEARLYRIDDAGPVELPRATLRVFRGVSQDGSADVLVTLEPESAELRGVVRTSAGEFWTVAPEGDAAGTHLLSSPEEVAKSLGTSPEWSCGAAEGPARPDILAPRRGAVAFEAVEDLAAATGLGSEAAEFLDAPKATQALPFTALRAATIAVDTDNELMQAKFSNSTTAAANYLVQLFATMNVIYERDLRVRLLQGTTYLRVSTTTDPWVQSSTTNQLQEFTSYWRANYGAVPRALAMLLSGKNASAYSSAGIAWIGGLCSTSYGYSVSQVFKYAGSTGASDGRVVPHEVGHNFGAPHTHCERSANGSWVDTCYNSAAGCYSGATSCPATTTINGVTGVRGTLMSYCHHLGGCSASNVFHPTTVANFSSYVESAPCLTPVDTPLVVHGFENGSFSPLIRSN